MEIRNWKTDEVIYQAEVNTMKELVEKAVKKGVSLEFADLRGAGLSGAGLRGVNLRGAYLEDAHLLCADLSDADLSNANLIYADLHYACLRNARLSGANLEGADLSRSDLHCAHLNGADLSGADLRFAENVPENIPMACPEEGAFIAWKKAMGKLVKLEIPEDARRSSATSKKCRCSKAKVLEITDLNGANPIDEVVNLHYGQNTIYRVGEMVYPNRFDDDRWNECSNGIHFFMNKQDAIDY